MKKFKLIIIDARRWFDRTYGNTYHSVTVTVKHARKEDLVLRCDYAYGYGEQYLQTAHELLHQAGYFGPEYWDFCDAMRNDRKKFHVTCVDVQRKKEL